MAFSFNKWIFARFPDYFKETDTYKNANNEGFFERYSWNFDNEIEQNTHGFIRDFLTILIPKDTPRKYLPLLAYALGDMTQVGIESIDRRIVAYAKTLNEIKGTAQSFKFIVNSFGLITTSIVEDLSHKRVHYDEEIIYDETDPYLYDTPCPGCIDVTITIEHPGDVFVPGPPVLVTIPTVTIDLIKKLLCAVTPIDVKVTLVRRTTA